MYCIFVSLGNIHRCGDSGIPNEFSFFKVCIVDFITIQCHRDVSIAWFKASVAVTKFKTSCQNMIINRLIQQQLFILLHTILTRDVKDSETKTKTMIQMSTILYPVSGKTEPCWLNGTKPWLKNRDQNWMVDLGNCYSPVNKQIHE